jgi:hypothetical protein
MSKDGTVFKRLATDLALAHPMLNGVTSTALYSFYTTIVAKRRELESFLRRASRNNTWRRTRLSDMAWELCRIDGEIKARQQRMASIGDKQLAEAKGNDIRMPLAIATLGGNRCKRRIEDVEDDEDYGNLEDDESAEGTEDAESAEDTVDDLDDLDFGECDQTFDSHTGEYPIDLNVFNNIFEAFPGPSSSTSIYYTHLRYLFACTTIPVIQGTTNQYEQSRDGLFTTNMATATGHYPDGRIDGRKAETVHGINVAKG